MSQAKKAILNEAPRLVYGREELKDEDALLLTLFGDGFTERKQELFFAEAKRMAKCMVVIPSWDGYADAMKIYAVGVCSDESGIRADRARIQAEADTDTRDSYFRASFWTFGMQRLVRVGEEDKGKIHNLYRKYLSDTDCVIVMVNSEVYGGSGGEISIVSRNDESLGMLLHELGHTIGVFPDEYFAGSSYTGECVSMSVELDPKKMRWSRFISKDGIGVCEHDNGGGGWYKPHQNCKMCYLERQFPSCEVCKEVLRDQFAAHTNVTKSSWQQYADTLWKSAEPLDLKQYVIARKCEKKETGAELDDRLTSSFSNADGKPSPTQPKTTGTHRLHAEFSCDAVHGDAVLETSFGIEPPDLIDLAVENEVCNGKPIEMKVTFHGVPPPDLHYAYRGTMPYVVEITHPYESGEPPVLPGRYTVTVTATEKSSGRLVGQENREFGISLHTGCVADHNTLRYPGAQLYYNSQTIVFTREGYRAEELDKFKGGARWFVGYFRALPLYKETDLYFSYYTTQAVPGGTRTDKEPNSTYYHVNCSDEDKLVQTDAGMYAAIYMVSNGMTSLYRAVIALTNGVYDVTGTTVTSKHFIVYVLVNEEGMRFTMMELLNYLSGKSESVYAVTEEERVVWRYEFLSALYCEWEEYGYTPVPSHACKENFPIVGEPVDLTPHFRTRVDGREVATSYQIHYFTEENRERGAEFSGASRDLGTYRAFVELVLGEGKDTCMAELDGQRYALSPAHYEIRLKIRACNRTFE